MRRQRSLLIFTVALLGGLLLLAGCKKNTVAPMGSNAGPTPGATSNPPDPGPTPTISLTASPTAVDRGGTSTLSWNSSNATSVVIDNGVGNVSGQGSIVISPRQSLTYTAVASAAGREARDSARVTVVEPNPTMSDPVSTDVT